MAIPPPGTPEEPPKPDDIRPNIGADFTVSVRSFAGAPSRRRRAARRSGRVYRLGPSRCQQKRHSSLSKFRISRRQNLPATPQQCPIFAGLCAALRPHSSAVLAISSHGWNRRCQWGLPHASSTRDRRSRRPVVATRPEKSAASCAAVDVRACRPAASGLRSRICGATAMLSVGEAQGTAGLDQGTVARAQIDRGRPSRSISATSRRCRSTADRAAGRPPPRLRAMVCRHDPDRLVRRGADGRRRFYVARRRDQFRRAARTRRSRAARRARRRRSRPPTRCARATGCRRRRSQRLRARSSASPPPPASATARSCACARSCASPAICR